MSKKLSIPSVNAGTMNNAVEAARFMDAVKQNLDVITGRARGVDEVPQLPDVATLAMVIATLNDVIRHLNATGE